MATVTLPWMVADEYAMYGLTDETDKGCHTTMTWRTDASSLSLCVKRSHGKVFLWLLIMDLERLCEMYHWEYLNAWIREM